MLPFYLVMLAALVLIIGIWNSVRSFLPAYFQALLFLEVMKGATASWSTVCRSDTAAFGSFPEQRTFPSFRPGRRG